MTGIKFNYEPGYVGAFTRNQVEGAFLNGSKIVKVKSEKDDAHAIGDRGSVLGSIEIPDSEPDRRIMYFIEWDNLPCVAVACSAWKLGQAT
jgi:hypothetical protein